jgi:hypothetical protein
MRLWSCCARPTLKSSLTVIVAALMLLAAPLYAQDSQASKSNPPESVQVPLIVPGIPSAMTGPELTNEEKLRKSVTTLFELIAKPDSRYATFASVANNARLYYIETQVDGNGDVMLFEGADMRSLLQSVFGPATDVTIDFGVPVTEINGAFGRVKMEARIAPVGREPEVSTIYLDAALEKPGWWTIFQITVSEHDKMARLNDQRPRR